MAKNSAFGEYLQARRKLVRPEDVELPSYGRRRVPGLRREEVAGLAGISVDYYVRLEQGKDHHPSPQVLDALARALRLDPPSTVHLHRLAQPVLQAVASPAPAGVAEGLSYLLVTLAHVPAFVQDRYMNVLAANPLAVALSPRNEPGTNVLRAAFLDPAERELYEDWEHVMEDATAGLRAAVGERINDPQLEALVIELSERSTYFRQLWGRHDVRPKVAGKRLLHHPVVGELELFHEKLAVTGTDGQLLVIHHAEPGSASERALERLARTLPGTA
ncbi:helix-turn-helix domain-containing protein [Arthrobacter sp. KBS0702]|uniref:helix-turn-helix domain-containing protein n=1 Tax=Arthrobacter sp. KBS0702 TaxID=2578107 RepID=UPI00110ECFF3|nr:helix-turn-helix transcriptional regulator [Arthrobacter sp. KBS0702]QDW29588.1 helix-turn-helix domain-containing protein [Arthrobacter sp. KBS0702]